LRGCNVVCCGYVAEVVWEDYGGFAACGLHDGAPVRRLLDRLQRPCAFWMDDRPVVVSVGDLTEDDVAPRPPPLPGAILAAECPRLAQALAVRPTAHPDADPLAGRP